MIHKNNMGTRGKTRHLMLNSLQSIAFFTTILNLCSIYKSMFFIIKIVHFKNIIEIKVIIKKNQICPISLALRGKMRQISAQ